MASDEASLRALEGLMNEFFAPNTTNERKRGIEEILNNFNQQKDAWSHCLYYMAHSHNQYVMMYCMTVLENLINRQWLGLEGQDKSHIRNTLNSFLLSHHDKVPSFVRNKLVKLVVDIGRLDWPHFYPSFLSNIFQLIQQHNTTSLGLILLQTTSEELAAPREDLSISRKEELHKLLLMEIPTMLGLLNGILEGIMEKHRSMVTATPPPSPTSGQRKNPSTPKSSSISVISSSPIQPNSILSNMFKSPSNRPQTESMPALDPRSLDISMLTLNCLSHLFSWIPLSTTITPSLLSTIFRFAAFGCETHPGTSDMSHSPGSSFGSAGGDNSHGSQQLGVIAMCCINELLSKNCVPIEFEDFLLQMFQQTFYLLQKMTKDSTTTSTGNKLSELDDSYIEKFTEFLRLFVSIHLRRFEANTNFPVLEFLSLLFRYTFKQPHNDGYFNCLEIWNVFLDYLSTKLMMRTGEGLDPMAVIKYKETLINLVSHILQKIQFRYNQSHLDELDDENLDDDSETEWQHFLRENLETIAKTSELLPVETFTLVSEPFRSNLDIYIGLEGYIATSGGGTRKLCVTAENECRRLHCSLRDLSSLLQALGRLADHFIGEKFMENFNDAYALVERLVQTAAYSTKLNLHKVDTVIDNVLEADFIEAHAQALAAVKAYATWLSQFYIESLPHKEQKHKCDTLLKTLLDTVLPLFEKQVPEKLVHSAAHLLLSIFTTVRPAFFLEIPQVQSFYNTISQGAIKDLPIEVQCLVYRSLSHYLLLPWPSLSDADQHWDGRATHHAMFIKRLTDDFTKIKDTPGFLENKAVQQHARPCIKRTLHIMKDLVESVSVVGVSKSKQICYQSLKDVIQTTLLLFPVYIHDPDVTDSILGFFLSLFWCLQLQMGKSFTEQTIQTFMSLFTSENILSETITSETAAGYKVVEKFLRILQVIVKEPAASFKTFLRNIITICMDQIYPLVAERPSPDIKPTLYDLLHEILQHNWRYFFKTSVIESMKTNTELVENEHQFIQIMQSFGQSFLQPDIAIFKQNLEALESLNFKYKLYHKKVFKQVMLGQFLNVLIQTLLVKSHDLLQEEIGITVYNMASVDFDAFYAEYLPHFLTNCDGLDDNQKKILSMVFKQEKDLPSFTQSVHRFVNDLRYYRLCNASLPSGSVNFN